MSLLAKLIPRAFVSPLNCFVSPLVNQLPSFSLTSLISRSSIRGITIDECREKYGDLWTRWENKRYFLHCLKRTHERGPIKPRKRVHPLACHPQLRGIVVRTLVKKPKKPNSANRKCVLVKLSTGVEKIVYVPGVGHNLQEHSVVLVRFGKTKDVPGLRLKVIRGVYDCAPIVRQSQRPG
ncbi:40S ribosomal protein S12, mitochondrial-like [Panonychus citri]|uniref:40S ribosomal protein S12, mitochondrial-like n=1 Tax=Panonychus citri TaxID=50023 RepID=UPI002307CFB4|nr:40S ribosomal protein S12, mitochondrial-like [Panonychus citri]